MSEGPDDPFDDEYRPVPPPQDRVWLHPSEMRAMSQAPAPHNGRRTAGFVTLGLVAVVAAAVALMSQGMQLAPDGELGNETRLTASTVTVATTAIVAVTSVSASLGIEGADAPGGIRVTRCHDKRAAARSGIRAGDLVVRVAGSPVRTWAELRAVMARLEPGDRTAVVVLRNGATLSMPLVLDHAPGTT